jgi:hypothetical protein
MGGGLMQLVAYGAQDVYLSGNPQITFFKVVYRRHTNFSVEPIQQTWNGAADFGRTVTCNINRNGDAISNMYLAVKLAAVDNITAPWGYCSRVGHAMVEETKVEIGGSKIDEQYGDWLNIWYELTHVVGQERGYAKMVGDVPNLTEVSTAAKRAYQLYVPLQYWFNRNNGLALPLIALQYHDVRITVKFRDWLQCVNWTTTTPSLASPMADSYLLIDYIYLDSEERKRFAQASHEYLIEQLQFTGSESLTSATNKYRLNFNHPSKYLVWAPHLARYASRTEWIAYAFDGDWAAAKDRFAKLIAVAASDGLTVGATTIVVTAPSGVAIGDLIEPARVAVAGISDALLAKVEVKFVATAVATEEATIASGAALLTDLLNNCIVTRNDLTMEDLSMTLAQLVGTNTGDAKDVLTLAKLSVINLHNYGNFLDGSDNPVSSAKLQLNGHDRFQARDGNYFNYVQPAQHFPNTPADGINVYSFALKAVDHQPTGTCNFSRIDNATLQVDCGLYNASSSGYAPEYLGTNSNSVLNIYTVNYNVLRVMSGMAGTAYSN